MVLNHLKTQEMCNETVHIEPLLLAYVPDLFKTQGMCNEAVRNKLSMMFFVPDHFKTMEMCNKIMRTKAFHHIPDHFKTQEMCNKAFEEVPSSLMYVPDWFGTQQQQEKLWHNYCDNDRPIKWHNGYKKRKPQKAKIEEELMPIAGIHQDGGIGACQKTRKTDRKIVEVTDSCFELSDTKSPPQGIWRSLITLRHKSCATKQCTWNQGSWGMPLNILKLQRFATRQSPTIHTC